MDIKIPEPLKVEHAELHAELVALTKAPGKVGEAARNVAVLLHPHFVKEEEYALPLLGLLAPIAQRGVTPEMREAIPRVSGRCLLSFWRTSMLSAATCM